MVLRGEELEFNLREWARKGHLTREDQSSRRFSASCIRSFREDHKSTSCTTNFTISSTASSPGYSLKDEIDPSNYSFTSALKALQEKTVYKKNWDWLKPEGVELNSKWNEAEKYICNPLSGEVPLECLSSKTLNSRSFRNLSTKHAPLMILPSNPNPNIPRIIHEDPKTPDPVLIQAEKKVVGSKRDVVSAPENVSAVKTTPIMERSTKRQVEADDSHVEYALKLKAQQEDVKLEEKEQNMMTKEIREEKKRGSGCFSMSWKKKMQKQPRTSKCIFLICLPHLFKAS
ncbi:uncharacterized protein LOC9318304 isoform X1 [Arabidopsis lyrata subsp. lyrata]|uniref:uncharacterized protein LOC9318304 isoform X1 n=1 Tax=Arabidopsis lyrata subsp. lyrata TaxID=81972 RepID=UPI000A29E55D|nr:uncharacterized protein LOC9318304 isoform X1 [Arabidopsis lyrata subsp. lyrata]|eukprot:XP_020888539.1 uncharacterized protein LOC9318304 isoform X1 [Arabidopsis lyrata subsp. lyrata]